MFIPKNMTITIRKRNILFFMSKQKLQNTSNKTNNNELVILLITNWIQV